MPLLEAEKMQPHPLCITLSPCSNWMPHLAYTCIVVPSSVQVLELIL